MKDQSTFPAVVNYKRLAQVLYEELSQSIIPNLRQFVGFPYVFMTYLYHKGLYTSDMGKSVSHQQELIHLVSNLSTELVHLDTAALELIKSIVVPVLKSAKPADLNKVFPYVEGNCSKMDAAEYACYFDAITNEFFTVKGPFRRSASSEEALMQCYVENEEGKKILNPFGGIGRLIQELSLKNDVTVYESNTEDCAIGHLYNAVHGTNISFVNKDIILNWPDAIEKYDLILISALYDKKSNSDFYLNQIESFMSTSLGDYILKRSFPSLLDKGKFIGLLPNEVLDFSNNYEILNRNYVEKVISFPGTSYDRFDEGYSLLVINKDVDKSGLIRLVDGSYFKVTKDRTEKESARDFLETFYESPVPKHIRITSTSQVKQYRCNLSIAKYFLPKQEGESLRSVLNSSTQTHNGTLTKVLEFYKYPEELHQYKLVEEEHFFELNIEELVIDNMLVSGQKIVESCLLVSLYGDDIRTAYYEHEHELYPLYANTMDKIYTFDTTKIDSEYLVQELRSDRVKEYFKAFAAGDFPSILEDEFLNIKVTFPSLEEQRRIAQERKANSIQKAYKKLEIQKRKLGLEIADANSFLRHKIAGPLKNMRSAFDAVQTILNRDFMQKFPELKSLKVHEKRTQTFESYLGIIARDLTRVSDLVKHSGKLTGISQAPLEPIVFNKFIGSFIDEIKDRLSAEVMIEFCDDLQQFSGNQANHFKFHGNADLIKDALENLVDNAVKHGLDHSKGEKRIQFRTSYSKQNGKLVVEVSNSGVSMNEKFDLSHYTRQGSKSGKSTGDGFGGWYINEIVKQHKGSLELITQYPTSEDGLVTTFKIGLPLLK